MGSVNGILSVIFLACLIPGPAIGSRKDIQIVIKEKGDMVIHTAALELQKYLLVIYLGINFYLSDKSELTNAIVLKTDSSLEPEEYLITNLNNIGFISGGSSKGILNELLKSS